MNMEPEYVIGICQGSEYTRDTSNIVSEGAFCKNNYSLELVSKDTAICLTGI